MKITIQHHVDDPYLEVGFTDLKTNEEAEKLKQQILEDLAKARKWDKFQNDLEKLGMTKEMKLLIEKSFANEFKTHNQNQKLLELVEKQLKDLETRKDTPKTHYFEFMLILQQLLEESKK